MTIKSSHTKYSDAYIKGFCDTCVKAGIDPESLITNTLLFKQAEENKSLVNAILNNGMVSNYVTSVATDKTKKLVQLLASFGLLKGKNQAPVELVQ